MCLLSCYSSSKHLHPYNREEQNEEGGEGMGQSPLTLWLFSLFTAWRHHHDALQQVLSLHFSIYSFLSQTGSAYSYPPSSSARCALVSLATADIIWSRAGSKGLVHGEGGLPVRDFDSGAGRLTSFSLSAPVHLLYRLNGKSCWRRRERLSPVILCHKRKDVLH